VNTKRILFMGSPAFAVPSLTMLAERPDLCQIVGVVTQPDKRAGRGRKLTPCPVKTAADSRGIPTYQPKSVRKAESLEALREFKADLVVVAAYGKILPTSVLEMAELGCVNVHASLLPKYRGASPITQAIVNGDAECGVSIMQLDEGMDTGDVHAMRAITIAPTDTCGTLTVKLAELGAKLLIDQLEDILSGQSTPEPQDNSLATHAPMLSKEDGRLDFSKPAAILERQLRAHHPWPGTFTMFGDTRVVITKAALALESGTPGHVIQANKRGLQIACGEQSLLVQEVKPAGSKLMDASSWVAGKGPKAGDQLGS
jgi:methionyl-tRNA formyltransferase